MQMIIKECLRDKYLTWHIANVMKDIKHPGLRMIWLFYHWSQDRHLGIDGDILTAHCWSWSKDFVHLPSGTSSKTVDAFEWLKTNLTHG